MAGGVYTDFVTINHSHVLGKSPQLQTPPRHLVGGFRFDNIVADNQFVNEYLDSEMVVNAGLNAINR